MSLCNYLHEDNVNCIGTEKKCAFKGDRDLCMANINKNTYTLEHPVQRPDGSFGYLQVGSLK